MAAGLAVAAVAQSNYGLIQDTKTEMVRDAGDGNGYSEDSQAKADVSVAEPAPPSQKNAASKAGEGMAGGAERYRHIVERYDWPVETALAVMQAESGGQATIVNDNPSTKDYSVGLFQINLYGNLAKNRPSEEWLKVPENNIEYAYKLYTWHGWKPWSVCRTKVKCN